jgi:arabinose-5-phosphate isomerase
LAKSNNHISTAKQVFDIESKSIADLSKNLTIDFSKAVDAVLKSKSRVIVAGIGKSGIIGKKISATLASTGTPSLFLHPTEAFHGDLGMVQKNDVVILISYSGETEELLQIIPFLKANHNFIIAITGEKNSTLTKNSNAWLNVKVNKEACPLELAPTSSTTATLAMGDALAVALMNARNFKAEDFAKYHPGGSLGKKLLTTVEQVMYSDSLPLVNETATMSSVIATMTKGRFGMAIVHANKTVKGIITDGDLRRSMEKHKDKFFKLNASQIMTKNPKAVVKEMKMAEAEDLMNELKITSLLVTTKGKIEGIVQLYNIK